MSEQDQWPETLTLSGYDRDEIVLWMHVEDETDKEGVGRYIRTDLCNAEEAVAIERRRCATILIDTLRDAKKEHASNKTLARFLEEVLKEVQNG